MLSKPSKLSNGQALMHDDTKVSQRLVNSAAKEFNRATSPMKEGSNPSPSMKDGAKAI